MFKNFCLLVIFLLPGSQSFSQEYKLKQTLEGHRGGITTLVHSEIIHALVAGDDLGYYYMYQASSGNLLKEFKGHDKAVRGMTFNSTGKLMMGIAADEIKIWDAEHFNLLHQIVHRNYEDIRFAL